MKANLKSDSNFTNSDFYKHWKYMHDLEEKHNKEFWDMKNEAQDNVVNLFAEFSAVEEKFNIQKELDQKLIIKNYYQKRLAETLIDCIENKNFDLEYLMNLPNQIVQNLKSDSGLIIALKAYYERTKLISNAIFNGKLFLKKLGNLYKL